MEKKSPTYVVVLSGILLGVVFTGVLSFFLIFFVLIIDVIREIRDVTFAHVYFF